MKFNISYLIKFALMTREREGKSERQRSSFHPLVFQKVRDARHYVVEKLPQKLKERYKYYKSSGKGQFEVSQSVLPLLLFLA